MTTASISINNSTLWLLLVVVLAILFIVFRCKLTCHGFSEGFASGGCSCGSGVSAVKPFSLTDPWAPEQLYAKSAYALNPAPACYSAVEQCT